MGALSLHTGDENRPWSRHITEISQPGGREDPKKFQREKQFILKEQTSEWVQISQQQHW